MNEDTLNDMLDMLLKATMNKRLEWKIIDSQTFFAPINDCRVQLSRSYDLGFDDIIYKLELYNKKHQCFDSYSYDKTADNFYFKLDLLFDKVRDVIFCISESKESIMNGLRELSQLDD